MTRNEDSSSIAEAYQQITEAENHASKLEKMLDDLDAKMESILQQANSIKGDEKKDKSTIGDKVDGTRAN
jgi:peptidoglycan hydrolase CwlO-like protein